MPIVAQNNAQSEPFLKLIDQLEKTAPFTAVSEELFNALGHEITLPDGGKSVSLIADEGPGGAFDPRDIEKIPAESLGYKAKWVVIRYPYYGLDWDITGLRLESLHPKAKKLPWLVIINGGSANVYEFFTDPLNRPGLGQYLAQMINVLIVTIPGNFKYGGWTLPVTQRVPQYLLDRELQPDEIKVRNAIYTNRMEMEGLKRLVIQETSGDILIVGHSTSGELAFLAMGEPELAERLKGRFLGWGSGGPSNLRRAWEEQARPTNTGPAEKSKFPPLWELRIRDAAGYVADGYIGPLNPCAKAGMESLAVAARWLSLVERNRPNIKQALQDLEHRGMMELQPELEAEINRVLMKSSLDVDPKDVCKDLFATSKAPNTGYDRMVWIVGKWDQKHWNKSTPEQAQELAIANQFRVRNPGAAIRVLVFDLPLTHYGHVEKPRGVAAGLISAVHWLVRS